MFDSALLGAGSAEMGAVGINHAAMPIGEIASAAKTASEVV